MKKQTCYVDYDPKTTQLKEGFIKACSRAIEQMRPGFMVIGDYGASNIVDRIKKVADQHGQTGLNITLDRR